MSKRELTSPRYRPSFTLIELLVAIAIIAIMAGMVLFALLGAQTDARVARTRGTIQKINEILLQKWEEYRYKPVNLQLPAAASAPIPGVSPPTFPVSPRENARLRMLVLRDNMRMEMPDRITDLLYEPSQYTVVYRTAATTFASTKIPRAVPPSFALVYNALRSNIISLQNQGVAAWAGFSLTPLPPTGLLPAGANVGRYSPQDDASWSTAVQSSELLYILISTSNYAGGNALELFRSSEIGDTDEDGLLEFIDGWGNAISWIRWPAGYPGDLVRYADDDAMDPLKTDWRYRPSVSNEYHPRTLIPLIISAGADGEFGVTFDFASGSPAAYATMVWPASPNPPYGTSTVGGGNNLHFGAGAYYYPDPFFTNGGGAPDGTNQLGSIPTPAAVQVASDNVTSHDIILEP